MARRCGRPEYLGFDFSHSDKRQRVGQLLHRGLAIAIGPADGDIVLPRLGEYLAALG